MAVVAGSKNAEWLALAGWIALAAAAGAIGGFASINAREFYTGLSRPSWAPPGWLFGPVWTVLYIMMGVAAWLVWRASPVPDGMTARRAGLWLFVAQLVLNALWTWIFFAWRQGAWAFADIIVLWLMIAVLIGLFGRVRPVAGWVLVPYLIWVSYASALTWAIWRGNSGRL